MRLLLRWLINAVSLVIVAHIVRGIELQDFMAALIGAIVFGFVNATLGLVLKILTFPLTIVTFGLFLIVINAIMLKMAAAVTPGFIVHTWTAAFLGAIVLSLVSAFLHWLIKDNRPVETRRY
ncbi:MAG TPA: phage holin family protein [Candidatus Dormibacteraeota bacterium]|jgi:putative membrane protein|nr:phage holin family protein [Candidatus Dormibacteraeota bacterium]